MIGRRRLDLGGFAEARSSFARLYRDSFSREERRRIGDDGADDDGALPGPALADLIAAGRCRFEAYFDGAAFVGAMVSVDLDRCSLGDYLVLDARRPDLSGLGGRMLRDWLAEARARDQDAVAEIAPLAAAPDRADATTRRRRRLFFVRNGFHLLDDVAYALPGGVAMSLAIRPRSSRATTTCAGRSVPAFAPGEVAEIAAAVSATYS